MAGVEQSLEANVKRVELVVAYDGTRYCGWQMQPNGLSVESVLNRHLTELLGEPIQAVSYTHLRAHET